MITYHIYTIYIVYTLHILYYHTTELYIHIYMYTTALHILHILYILHKIQ